MKQKEDKIEIQEVKHKFQQFFGKSIQTASSLIPDLERALLIDTGDTSLHLQYFTPKIKQITSLHSEEIQLQVNKKVQPSVPDIKYDIILIPVCLSASSQSFYKYSRSLGGLLQPGGYIYIQGKLSSRDIREQAKALLSGFQLIRFNQLYHQQQDYQEGLQKRQAVFSLLAVKSQHLQSTLCLINQSDQVQLGQLIQQVNSIILTDGAANFMYRSAFRDCIKIRTIIGDFDSIKPQVLEYYKQKGTQICYVEQQDNTDFFKALRHISNFQKQSKILVWGGFSRLDHMFANFSALQIYACKPQAPPYIFMGQNKIVIPIVPFKRHLIQISCAIKKKQVGIICLGGQASLQTKGLRWELGKDFYYQRLNWPENISTSNEIIGDQFEIKTTAVVLVMLHSKKDYRINVCEGRGLRIIKFE